MPNDDAKSDESRVREHLANERTYLAWIRTGVAIMGLGVVIAKLKYILGSAYQPSDSMIHAADIGLFFAGIGILTIALSALFFVRTQNEIRSGTYHSRKFFVVLLTALMLTLGLLIIWYLLQATSIHGS